MEDDEFLAAHYPGASAARARIRQLIAVANQPAAIAMRQPILILGESGCGKGYLAELIADHRAWLRLNRHERSRYIGNRRALTIAAFQTVLLPGLPEPLIESELFGHRKGAFTGADREKVGIFGTETVTDLLLDEIGDAPMALQAKLLEVIETGEYRPVGAGPDAKRETGQRLLLATNRDLSAAVSAGLFRADLLWRIAQLVIKVPPLSAQRDEIPTIMNSVRNQVLGTVAAGYRDQLAQRTFSDSDVSWAMNEAWPGNVRELTRTIRLWLLMPDGAPLADVPSAFPLPTSEATESPEWLIEQGVARWWREIVTGRRTTAGTVATLLSDLTSVLRRAVVKHSQNAEERATVFHCQGGSNVSRRLGKWAQRQ